MNADHFVKVFDVLDSGFKSWSFPAFGLIFVGIGLLLFFLPKIIEATGLPNLKFPSRGQTVFRYVFLGFAILWAVLAFLQTYSAYLRHEALARTNECRIIEGPVENFTPMPSTGHAMETFSVAGVKFSYSDYVVTDGFNNTASHGGPIRSDSYVRVCYDPSDHVILRLEIRNFHGEQQDHAKSPRDFSPSDVRQPGGKKFEPWYGNLFVIVLLLDWLARLALFVPYLRTFFRLKILPLRECPVPDSVESGKRTKLRNSLIYREASAPVIWLRPRGLNFVNIQLMVAALKLSPDGKRIAEAEIRFSSGFPLGMALFMAWFCWTVYITFASPMPAGVTAVLFLVFLVVSAIGLHTIRSRMETLIKDAVSELEQM